jgi:HK97 family phage major capsid protein
MTQVSLAFYPVSGFILHPDDWESIELTKTSEGAYVFANPLALAGPTLWGRPVIATAAQTAGEFTLGAFNMAAQIFDREDITVEIATENEDDFVNNRVTIRGEERLALAIHRPEAIVDGSFPQT